MMIISPDLIRYATSFRFSGDYVDKKDVDTHGRRKTRIVAIDALCSPGTRQYRENFILRFVDLCLCGYCFIGCIQNHHYCGSGRIYKIKFII